MSCPLGNSEKALFFLAPVLWLYSEGSCLLLPFRSNLYVRGNLVFTVRVDALSHALRCSLTVLEVAIILSAVLGHSPFPEKVGAQSSSIDLSQEYSSGDVQVFEYLQAWYSWVNVNGTRMIFLALHSPQNDSPVSAFAGQGYNTSSGSKVFVANAVMAMEIYNDTNGNGFLDADYSIGTTELLYTLLLNASQTFTTRPVLKTLANNVPHYRWGVTYGSVQAILIQAVAPGYGYGGGTAASNVIIDHVSIDYDYSINSNTTILKTSYDIGSVTLVPPTLPNVTLQGLSLSLLHTTLTVSSERLAVVAGTTPYDSQTNTSPTPVTAAQVNVDNALAYEFRFNDNYTLLTDPAASYPAVYLASPMGSIPPNVSFPDLIRVQDYVRASLPGIAGLPSTSELNYATSKFIYRVSYPSWSGYGLTHDPTYVAYFGQGSPPSPPEPPGPGFPITIISIAAVASLLAVGVVYALARKRKTGRIQS